MKSKKINRHVSVTFRKFEDGGIIALFPDTSDGSQIVSYEHEGQHGMASCCLLDTLAKASCDDYKDLFSELDEIYKHTLLIV